MSEQLPPGAPMFPSAPQRPAQFFGSQAARAPSVSRVNKMTLANVKTGTEKAPARVLLYGPEKLGKSTWAAGAPKPLMLSVDGGAKHVNVPKLPRPETFDDVIDACRFFAAGGHGFMTLVIDPFNWIEALIWAHVCRANGWKDIEAPSFGKGYVAANDEWRRFIKELDLVHDAGFNVVLVGHEALVTFKNPEGDDYERFSIPIHKSAAKPILQWVDAVLFAQHEVVTQKAKNALSAKGLSTGYRLIRTQPSAAYQAGTRYSLPDPMPLEAHAFWAAVEASDTNDVEGLRAQARHLAAQLGPDAVAHLETLLVEAGDDARRIIDITNRINSAIAEATANQGTTTP